MSKMRAIGIEQAGGIENLKAFEVEKPTVEKIKPHDIIVKVVYAAINPVDYKVRQGGLGPIQNPPKILGWDASGIVEAVGPEAKKFKVGDEVYFAGDITRQGSNAEYAVVDERIAALKPRTLTHAQAAVIPLTGLTAWEGIFEELQVPRKESASGAKKVFLVIGGAGGVGSLVTQIAKKLLNVTVVSTASRPETVAWTKDHGADHVINHRQPFKPQLSELGFQGVDYVFNTSDPENNWNEILSVLNPFAKIVCILGSPKALDIDPLFFKRASAHFEFMFARPMFGVEPEKQGEALAEIARLIDEGVLKTTINEEFDMWTEISKAHQKIESGTTIGKIALRVQQ